MIPILIALCFIGIFGILGVASVMEWKERDALDKKWRGHPLRVYFTAEDLEKASDDKWTD